MITILVVLGIPAFFGSRLIAEKRKNARLREQVDALERGAGTPQLSTEEVYQALKELHPELSHLPVPPAKPEVVDPPQPDPSIVAARLAVIGRLPRHGPSQVSKLKELCRELIASGQLEAASDAIDLLPPSSPSRIALLKELESALARRGRLG